MKQLEQLSDKLTQWVGTPLSVLIHTIIFIGIFSLKFFGFNIDQILLILTTAVSLEAIYLAIFIQISVNKASQSIAGVEKDIDDIQEDVDDIQLDVDSIEKDVDDIQEDVKEISEEYAEDEQEEDEVIKTIKDIEKQIIKLHQEVIDMRKSRQNTP